jgi:hypothetical protein
MRYIKTFEENNDELLNNLKDLSGKMSQLNTLVKQHRRQFTPKELLEDYFLEFKESEKYHIDINQQFYLIAVSMDNALDKNRIEEEFNRILNKLTSIKDRIEKIESYQCHFEINLGGVKQSNHNSKTMRNDDYQYKGFGDRKYGWIDNKYFSINTDRWQDIDKYPDDKVPISIRFFIV